MSGLPFTLRQLEVFERVCDTRNFRKASEDLGISQASVSNQLKALEEQLGVRLLTREPGKRPQLTPDGAAFLVELGNFWEASKVLASHRRTDKQSSERKPVRLRGVLGPYLFRDFVRPKLDRFFTAHPKILLNVIAQTMTIQPQHIFARENCDFALYYEAEPGPLGVDYRELARTQCGIYGHPKFLTGRDTLLSADEVGELPFLMPQPGTYYEHVFLAKLAKSGIKPMRIVGRTGFFDVMSEAIERGSLVCATIEPLLVPEDRRMSVLLFRLEDFRLTFYKNPETWPPEMDFVEDFLISATVGDPNYPHAEPLALAS
jgi:DNA-binding transcriptional LysR family regulator